MSLQRSPKTLAPFPTNWVFSRDYRYVPIMTASEKSVQQEVLSQEVNQKYIYEVIEGVEDIDNIARLAILEQWAEDAAESLTKKQSIPLMPPIPNGRWGKRARKMEIDIKAEALDQWIIENPSQQNNSPYETMLSRRPRKNQEVANVHFTNKSHGSVKSLPQREPGDDHREMVKAVAADVLNWEIKDIRVEDIEKMIKFSAWKKAIIQYYKTDFPDFEKSQMFLECKVFESFTKKS